MTAIPIMLLERFIISNCVIIVTFKRNTGLPYFQESTTMFDLHHLFVGAEIFSGTSFYSFVDLTISATFEWKKWNSYLFL